MSQTIENRIVEMQFENKQFESGVQESLSTLDKLKKALKFDDMSKNLMDFSKSTKNFDLNGIGNAVEEVGNKFSTMRLVGIHALNNIVDSAMAAGKRIAQVLTAPIQQIKTGGWSRAMNIEEAKFQLEGLKVAWEDVSQSIDDAVSGTAYGLDAAAKAAAQFAASGVNLGEDMTRALRGISGVAAMGNTEYENIAQIFTKGAGQGRVMADELNRVSQYGINAAATLANFFNTIEENEKVPEDLKLQILDLTEGLQVSESEIRDFASSSKISFRAFAYAMDDAFGEHAKDANKTFFGALSNIKAALSRIGAEFATPFIKDAIPVLNKVRELVNAIKGNMGNLFTTFANVTSIISDVLTTKLGRAVDFMTNEFSGSINLYRALQNVVEALVRIFVALREAFREVFPPANDFGDKINSMAEGIEKFTEKLVPSESAMLAFKNIMVAVFSIFKAVGSVIKAIAPILGKVLSIAVKIISVIAKLLTLIINFVSQLNLLEIAFNAIQIAGGLFMILVDKLRSAFLYLKNILSDTTTVTGQFAAKVKDAVTAIVFIVGGTLYTAFTKVKEFITGLISNRDPLGYIVNSFKKLVSTLKNIPVISNIISALEKAVSVIKNFISEMRNSESIIGFITEKIKGLALVIGGTLYMAFSKAITIIREFITSGHPIELLISKVKSLIATFKELEFVKRIVDYVKNAFSGLVSIFNPVADSVNKTTECVKTLVGVTEKGERVIEETFEMAEAHANSPAIAGVQKTLTKTGEVVETTSNMVEKSKDIFSSFFSVLETAFNKIKGFFGPFNGILQAIQDKIAGLKASNIVLAIFAMRLVVMAYNTDQLILALGSLARKLSGGFINMFKTPLTRFTKFASAMLQITAAISALAYAFYKLKDVPVEQLDAITKSLGKIILYVGGFSLLAAIITDITTRFGGGNGFNNFATNMFILSASLLALLGALKIIDSMNLKNARKSVGVLIAIMMAIAGLSAIMSFIPKLTSGSLFMVAFAAATLILVKALDNLSQIDFKSIKTNWKEITLVILAFAATAAVASTVGVSSLFGLITFFFGLNVMSKSLEKIKNQLSGVELGGFILEFCSRLKNTIAQAVVHLEGAYRSLTTFDKIFISLIGLLGGYTIHAALRVFNNTTKYIRRIALSTLLFAAALAGLMYAYYKVVQACQGMDSNTMQQVTQALIGIGGFLAVLSLIGIFGGDSTIEHSSNKGKNKTKDITKRNRSDYLKQVRKMLLDMAILLASITLFLKVIGDMTVDELNQATAVLQQVLIFIGAVALISQLITLAVARTGNGAVGFGTFLGIIALIGTLITTFVVAMNYFKDFKIEEHKDQLIATIVSMIAIVVIIGLFLRALSRIQGGKAGLALLGFASIIVAIGGVVAGLLYITKGDMGMLKAAAEIAGGLLVFLVVATGLFHWISAVMTKYPLSKSSGIKKLVIAMIALIIAISGSILLLTKQLSGPGELARAGIIAGALMGSLAIIFTLMQWIQKSTEKHLGTKLKQRGLIATIASMIALIIAISADIALLAKAFPEWEDLGKLGSIAGALIIAIGALVGLSVILVKFVGSVDQSVLIKAGAALGAMLVTFFIMSIIFRYIINNINVDGVWSKSQAIIVALGELIVLAWLITILGNVIQTQWQGAIIGGVAILAMIGIFALLTKVFKTIDAMNVDGLREKARVVKNALWELIAIAGVIALFGSVLGELTGFVGALGVLIGGVVLTAFIGLFHWMAHIFTIIDDIKTDGMYEKSRVIRNVMWELIAIATVSIFALVGLPGMVSMAAMTYIFKSIAETFVVIDSIKTDGMYEKSRIIRNVMWEFVGMATVLGILSGLVSMAQFGVNGIIALINTMVIMGVAFDKLSSMNLSQMEQTADTMISILWKLTAIGAVNGAFGFIGGGLESIAGGIVILGSAFESVAGNVITFSNSLLVLTSAISMFTTTSSMIKSWFTDIGNGLSSFCTSVLSIIYNTGAAAVLIVDNTIGSVVNAIFGGGPNIFSASADAGSQAQLGFESTTKDSSKWGLHLIENFASGIISGIASALNPALGSVVTAVAAYMKHTEPQMGEWAGNAEHDWGLHLMQNFAGGILDGIPTATGNIQNFIGIAKNKFFEMVPAAKDAGSKVGQMLSEALGSKFPEFNSICDQYMGSIFNIGNAIKSISSAWSQGRGTLSEFQYQLTTDATRQEKRVDRLREAYSRLGDKGSESARKLSEQIRIQQDELNNTNKALKNIGKASSDIDNLTSSFEGLAGTGGKKGKGSGGIKSATNELVAFQEELEGVLEGQMNIFQKFEKKEAMSKDELLANMRSQIQGMTEWAAQMQSLAARGLDQGLYQELAMMGPQGAEYVGAFAQMTAEELMQANQLWAQSLVLPKQVAGQVAGAFGTLGQNLMAGEAAGIRSGAGEMLTAQREVQQQGIDAANDVNQTHSPSIVYWNIGRFLMEGLGNGIKAFGSVPINRMKSVCNEIISAARTTISPSVFYSMGFNAVAGLANGLTCDESKEALKKALAWIRSLLDKFKEDDLLEHSPSRLTEEWGKNLTIGLANGIVEKSGMISNSLDTLSDDVLSSMRDTIAMIGKKLTDDIDDPVITPVLDLSNVEAGARTLSNMFSSNQALRASASLNLQNEQSDQARFGTTFIQNNYSPKALSRTEIYRQTKNQFSAYREAFG